MARQLAADDRGVLGQHVDGGGGLRHRGQGRRTTARRRAHGVRATGAPGERVVGRAAAAPRALLPCGHEGRAVARQLAADGEGCTGQHDRSDARCRLRPRRQRRSRDGRDVPGANHGRCRNRLLHRQRRVDHEPPRRGHSVERRAGPRHAHASLPPAAACRATTSRCCARVRPPVGRGAAEFAGARPPVASSLGSRWLPHLAFRSTPSLTRGVVSKHAPFSEFTFLAGDGVVVQSMPRSIPATAAARSSMTAAVDWRRYVQVPRHPSRSRPRWHRVRHRCRDSRRPTPKPAVRHALRETTRRGTRARIDSAGNHCTLQSEANASVEVCQAAGVRGLPQRGRGYSCAVYENFDNVALQH